MLADRRFAAYHGRIAGASRASTSTQRPGARRSPGDPVGRQAHDHHRSRRAAGLHGRAVRQPAGSRPRHRAGLPGGGTAPRPRVVRDRPLIGLLGRTRADLLGLTASEHTTTELAQALKVGAATISGQTRALRAAGLISTTRVGKCVLHSLTPWGPGSWPADGPLNPPTVAVGGQSRSPGPAVPVKALSVEQTQAAIEQGQEDDFRRPSAASES